MHFVEFNILILPANCPDFVYFTDKTCTSSNFLLRFCIYIRSIYIFAMNLKRNDMTIFANTTKEELEAKIEAITHHRPKHFRVIKLEDKSSSLFQIALGLTTNLSDILEFGIVRFNPTITANKDSILITFIVPVI